MLVVISLGYDSPFGRRLPWHTPLRSRSWPAMQKP